MLLLLVLSWPSFYSLFWAFLFCHFVLAVFYALKLWKKQFSNPQGIAVFLGLNIFWVVAALQDWITIATYFGLHFALTEAFIFQRFLQKSQPPNDPESLQKVERLLLLRTLFAFQTYLFVIDGGPAPSLPLYLLTIAVLAWQYWKNQLLRWPAKDLLAFDLFEILVVAVFLYSDTKVHYVVAIFYHLVVWYIVPSLRMLRTQDFTRYGIFSTSNVVLTLLFLTLTPVIPIWQLTADELEWWATMGGFFHISMTFISSESNLSWQRLTGRFELKDSTYAKN